MTNVELEALLEDTIPHAVRRHSHVPSPSNPRLAIPRTFKAWARSQVAAYRIGLILGYLATIYFGTSALIAGIPAFEIAAPEGWTPIWAISVIIGGLIAAAGAVRAGEEPVTRDVRIFNRTELVGAILLFLTLGGYAVVLLVMGYAFNDAGRAAVGSGFVALGVHPAVRMVWLIFRPSKSQSITASNPTVSPAKPSASGVA